MRLPQLAAIGLLAIGTLSHGAQPPIGVPVPRLGTGPWMIDTAEQHRIRVSVVTRGLSHPWAIAFLSDNTLLITERPGRLRYVRDGVLDPQPISGLPAIRTDGNGGLMDIALHPQFQRNRLVYFTYTKPVGNRMGTPALARGRLEGHALVNVEDLLVPAAYAGNSGLNGRVAFGRDGKVYFSTGGRSEGDIANVAQDLKSLRGKVLRLNEDGSVPPDNPFVGREGYRPEIYTLGHRNTLGGDKFPAWKGNVFVGGLTEGRIPGTGHLQRVVFNENTEEIRRESMLREFRQRIREVRQGPDGFLYLLTDEDDGALLRIEPASL
jgi:aldose sugar dehydrogenase